MCMELGMIGAVFILVAWLPQTIKSLKDRERDESWAFMLLYTFGTLLLLVHSVRINDIPFTLLNGVILAVSCVNLSAKVFWWARKS